MIHFGTICPTATGHLNTMTALGRELKRRGHRVTVLGMPDAETYAQAAGLEFRAISGYEFPIGTTAKFYEQLGKLNGLAALRYTISLSEKLQLYFCEMHHKLFKKLG